MTLFTDEMWRASSPYKLSGLTKQYKKTKTEANDAVMQSGGRYKGYSKLENGNYYLNTGDEKELAVGHIAVERLGRYRSYSNYMWSTHVNEKLTGYADTKRYSSLETAMSACAGSHSCNGVTQEGSGNFRINTGSEPSSAAGKTAYLKGSSYTLTDGKKILSTLGELGSIEYLQFLLLSTL